MSRTALALLLLVSLAATGAVAFLLVEGVQAGRGDRDQADVAPPSRPRTEPPLSGHVRDEAGRPIPGATVLASVFGPRREQVAVTDEQGRYELIELTNPALTFDVYARGFLPLAGLVNGSPNGELDFVRDGDGPWVRDFTLQRAASLTGRVLDESGVPVKGATVYVLSPEHQIVDHRTVGNVVTADERGEFVFPGLSPGTHDLGARAGGFLPGMVKDVEIVGHMPVARDVLLRRGRRIRVTVELALRESEVVGVWAVDSRLRDRLLPPGGVDALADALVGRSWIDHPVVTEPRRTGGVYVLAGLGAGPADVWARAVGHLTEEGLGRLLDTTEEELTLRLVLGVLIKVHVRHAVTGEPLEPEIVRRTRGVSAPLPLRPLPPRDLLLVPLDDRSHALHFALEGFQATKLDLPDLRPAARPEPVAWAEYPNPFDVVMMPEAQGETGAFYLVFEPPLEGRVALVGRDAEGKQQWVRHLDGADEEGRWEVKTIPAGEYAVSVLASGMVPVTLPRVVVTRTLKETHKILLARGGGVAFKVTD
ncbi:MAG: carboxypeptidase-like regulatory domain-containing protein, partial [Planctomycetota bacterium]